MWLFTTVGFFSVTQVCHTLNSNLPAGTLQIRARVYDDLELLREKYLPELTETIHIPGRDYPYRGYVDKASFSAAMVEIISDVTYSNFKDEVKHSKGMGADRADLYMGVWGVMFDAEEKLDGIRKRAKQAKARKKAAPMLPFERVAEKELRDEEFERQLHKQLLEQERERERRIEEMRWSNTWGRSTMWDKYEAEPGVGIDAGPGIGLDAEHVSDLMDLEGMSVISEDDLFSYGTDDEYGDDIEVEIEEMGAVPLDHFAPAPKSKRSKRSRKRSRKRGRRLG